MSKKTKPTKNKIRNFIDRISGRKEKDRIIVCWVRYKDHHWFDGGLSLDDIEMYDEQGGRSILKTDIGILQKETDEYIIVSSHIEEKNIPEYDEEQNFRFKTQRPTVYENTSRIMKHDVVEYIKWYLTLKKP